MNKLIERLKKAKLPVIYNKLNIGNCLTILANRIKQFNIQLSGGVKIVITMGFKKPNK